MQNRKSPPLSGQTRNKLEQAKTNITELLDVIQNVLDGRLSQEEATHRLHLHTHGFHRNLDNQFMYELHKIQALRPSEILSMLKEVQTPYERLFYDIFGLNACRDRRVYLLTFKDERLLDSLIDTYLSERYADIIRKRYGIPYGKPMTLKEIADRFQVQPENIRQIEAKALQKLRRPEVWQKLCPRYRHYVAAANQSQPLHGKNLELKEKAKRIVDEKQSAIAGNLTLDTPIEKLELSARVRHVLKRENIHAIGDLIRHSEEEIGNYRSLGTKSLKELRTVLKQHDIHLD